MSVYALAGLILSLPLGRAMDRRGMLGFLHAAFAPMMAGNLLLVAWPTEAVLALFGAISARPDRCARCCAR